MKKLSISAIAIILSALLYTSCTKSTTTASTCGTTTVSYATYIKPLMTAKCNTSGCHDVATASGGHELTTYDGVKGAVDEKHFYESMTRTGSNYMPSGGARMSTTELANIKSWVDACAPNN